MYEVSCSRIWQMANSHKNDTQNEVKRNNRTKIPRKIPRTTSGAVHFVDSNGIDKHNL